MRSPWRLTLQLALLLALLIEPLCAATRTICVTKNRAEAPRSAVVVPTIEQGIRTAGRFRARGEEVTLLLGGGTYDLTKTIELTDNEVGNSTTKLTIEPLNEQRVVLRGGVEIAPELIPTTGAVDERIQAEMRGKILRIDLKESGIKELGTLRNSGFSRPALAAWSEVFVNSEAQRLSRWPNDTMALMGKVHETGSIPRVGEYDNRGGSFEYFGERPSTWKSAPEWIAGYFAYGYADDMVRIAQIDTLTQKITLAEAVMYGLISGQDYNRYYVVNLLEEVDRPGEYYLDFDNQQLWIYPSAPIERLEISTLAEPMLAIEGVNNIEISGISFECSRGIGVYMERTEGVIVRDCSFSNLGATAVVMGKGITPAPVFSHEYSGEPISRMIGSLAQHLYNHTELDREAGHRNGIINCTITDVGAGGVSLAGGNRKTLTAGENYVENCRIARYNRVEKSYRPAIDIMGVGNRISHCEIYDAPSSAVMLHGNDHLIEYCEIYDVCNEVDDLGAIYYGRDPSEQGNKIIHNYIHHLSAKHRVTALYHDDGACGMYVYGNILYKAGLQPVLLGGGSDHTYQNNLFIDTPYGMYVDNRMENWANNPTMNELIKRRFEAIDYLNSPFCERYPHAANYFEEGFQRPKRNTAHTNLYYNISKLLICPGERPYERAYLEMYNNWVTWSGKGFEEPGFVDEQAENWNLRADAPIFKYIPGFEAIPFDKIGCSLPK